MKRRAQSTYSKALQINNDPGKYGTFAEIGAGQEVARHFFQAGKASNTVAKTMSAYDMTISDSIYGKTNRYVSEPRLLKMIEREFRLLDERLSETKGKETCFFAFANTVATSSKSRGTKCHGWLGVRLQTKPGGPPNDIVIHVQMKDTFRLQQQEALGVLGVNLIHACYYYLNDTPRFVRALVDNLSLERIEVDMLRFTGPELAHIDNRLVNLELVLQGLSPVVMFDNKGTIVQAAEKLYGTSIILQRGTFRPVTLTDELIIQKGLKQMTSKKSNDQKPMVLLEISMNRLSSDKGHIDYKDFLDRVDTLNALGHNVLLSNYRLFYDLKAFLRSCTSEDINLLVGASLLEKLFDEKLYKSLKGGILEAFGLLFDKKVKLSVFPYKTEKACYNAQTFKSAKKMQHLFKHLFENGFIQDISNCEDVDTSIKAETVREYLKAGDKKWEDLVPLKAKELIKSNKLFGLRTPKK